MFPYGPVCIPLRTYSGIQQWLCGGMIASADVPCALDRVESREVHIWCRRTIPANSQHVVGVFQAIAHYEPGRRRRPYDRLLLLQSLRDFHPD